MFTDKPFVKCHGLIHFRLLQMCGDCATHGVENSLPEIGLAGVGNEMDEVFRATQSKSDAFGQQLLRNAVLGLNCFSFNLSAERFVCVCVCVFVGASKEFCCLFFTFQLSVLASLC